MQLFNHTLDSMNFSLEEECFKNNVIASLQKDRSSLVKISRFPVAKGGQISTCFDISLGPLTNVPILLSGITLK